MTEEQKEQAKLLLNSMEIRLREATNPNSPEARRQELTRLALNDVPKVRDLVYGR